MIKWYYLTVKENVTDTCRVYVSSHSLLINNISLCSNTHNSRFKIWVSQTRIEKKGKRYHMIFFKYLFAFEKAINELTKHIEQVKSRSSLIESKSSQESEGLPSLIVREHSSKKAGGFFDLVLLVSLRLMWKAISSHSHGDWRISMCILCACDLNACPCFE